MLAVAGDTLLTGFVSRFEEEGENSYARMCESNNQRED